MAEWSEDALKKIEEARKRGDEEAAKWKVGDLTEIPGGQARLVKMVMGGFEVQPLGGGAVFRMDTGSLRRPAGD